MNAFLRSDVFLDKKKKKRVWLQFEPAFKKSLFKGEHQEGDEGSFFASLLSLFTCKSVIGAITAGRSGMFVCDN